MGSSAVDYIFDAENIASLERQAGREKLMLVDIAVPRNVDPDCDQLDDVRAYDVDSLSSREIEAVERLSRGIVSKLLHGPMSSLRGEGSTDDKKNTLSALKKMFGV